MEIMGYKWIVGQRMDKMLRQDFEGARKLKGTSNLFETKREKQMEIEDYIRSVENLALIEIPSTSNIKTN